MPVSSQNGYIEAIIEFRSRKICFNQQFVGREYPVSIGGVKYQVCFPNFDFMKLTKWGAPRATFSGTNVKINWLERDRESLYGICDKYVLIPKSVSLFNLSVLVVRSTHKITSVQARKTKRELTKFQEDVPKWIEAITFQDLTHHGINITALNTAQTYYLSDKQGHRFREVTNRKDYIPVVNINKSREITEDEFKVALSLASKKDDLPGYHLYLIQSLLHLNRVEYRQAVLDAATSFEMALTQLLELKLSRISVSEKKLITDKYEQIVNLSKALRVLGVSVPTEHEIVTKLARPRNRATHKGVTVSESEAKVALQFVRDFIHSNSLLFDFRL